MVIRWHRLLQTQDLFFKMCLFQMKMEENTFDKSVMVQDLFRVRKISPPPNLNFFLVFPTKYKWKKTLR